MHTVSHYLFTMAAALAICYSPGGLVIAQITDQVDRDETLRRGDMVTRAGSGPRDAGIGAIADAMAPPADDSNRFFFSVILDGSEASRQLESDLAKNDYLRAFVRPDEPRTSWAHFNRYQWNDNTQSWRWKSIKVSSYPVILIQPPRNKRYGDPATVVCQLNGYTDAKTASNKIRKAVAEYVRRQAETAPTPGPRQTEQERGYDSPFALPPATPSPAPAPPMPAFEIPPQMQPQPNVNAGALLVSALVSLLGGNLTNLLLLAILAMQGWRYYRTKSGLPTLLADDQFSALIDTLKAATGQKPSGPAP